jgi:hypothetical protein
MKRLLDSCCFKAFIAAALVLIFSQDGVMAQSGTGLWTGVSAKKDLPKGMNAEIEAEWRQTGFFTETDRWSVGASFSKRLYRNKAKTFNIKADLGYKYISSNRQAYTVDKSEPEDDRIDGMPAQYYIDNLRDFNLTNAFWESRHRISASLSAGYELGRFKFGIRERLQYTYSCGKDSIREKHRFGKIDMSTGDYLITVAGVDPSQKTMLRSRISVDYDIPHFKLDPFASYEIFSDLSNSEAFEKGRLTVGAGFSLKKKHAFQFAYIWQNAVDEDESVRSALSINYTFKF